jgi:hypothetical protein
MPKIEDVQRVLEPYHDALHACVIAAWKRWKEDFAPRLQLPYPRCRANVIYDLMIEEARKRFSGLPEVAIVEGVQRALLSVGDLLLRFKKVDDQLHTRNYPTQGALQYDAQLRLPGVPRGTRVTIGYRVDEFRQQLSAIFVILAAGRRVLGAYELLPNEGLSFAPTPLPMAPIVPFPAVAAGGRISRRIDETAEKQGEEEGEADKHEQT